MNNWTEFEWEAELRVDDKRIQKYMNEISKFIDLPKEEEIILKRITSDKKLISHQDVVDVNILSILEKPNEDEFFDNWDTRKGANIYIEIEKLASVWSTLFVKIKNSDFEKGINIVCRYGKLLAKLADLVDLDARDIPGLKIAVCKRVYDEINNLIGDLYSISDCKSELGHKPLEHIEHLKISREKILKFIKELRNPNTDCPF